MLPRAVAAALHIFLHERRQAPRRVLPDRLDERELRVAGPPAQLHAVLILTPVRDVGDEIDPEDAAGRDDARDRGEGRREIARPDQRLQDPVGGDDHREGPRVKRESADVSADETQRRRIGDSAVW